MAVTASRFHQENCKEFEFDPRRLKFLIDILKQNLASKSNKLASSWKNDKLDKIVVLQTA